MSMLEFDFEFYSEIPDLGTVVALMFWIYLSSWIIIFGAHLSAAIARHASKGRAA